MRHEHEGLPPRRSRHHHTTRTFSMKKAVQSGLVVFGALFFGLIGLELYKAKVATQPTLSVSPQEMQAEAPEGKQAAADSDPVNQGEGGHPTPAASTGEVATQTAAPAAAGSVEKAPSPRASAAPTATATATKPQQQKKEATQTNPAGSPNAPSEKPKVIRHVVEKGETLYMLSRKYYGNNSGVSRIAKYNGFHEETQLIAGKVVMIPISR